MRASAGTVLREWGRLGCIGFGGPPTHIAPLRQLCVARRGWLSEREFEDAIAACNLLPGPASTQLAIFCAWRVRGPLGALVGGLGFGGARGRAGRGSGVGGAGARRGGRARGRLPRRPAAWGRPRRRRRRGRGGGR